MKFKKLRRRGTDGQRIARLKKWARSERWAMIWNHFPTVARMIPLPRENGDPVLAWCGTPVVYYHGRYVDLCGAL